MKKRIIVVGAGIAGSLLALELLERGCEVTLFDDPDRTGSSHIAAGMINPITGRKFVKSWNIDGLLQYVKEVYFRIESKYDKRILHPVKLLRAIKNTGMLNDWSARLSDPDYQQYIDKRSDILRPSGIKKDYLDYTLIKDAYRVDFGSIIDLAKTTYGINFRSEKFDYDKMHLDLIDMVDYEGQLYDDIIFCEGNGVRHNDHWNWLPFVPARGERFIIHAPDLKLDQVFNDGKLIIPLQDDKYWVGSNYDWDILEPIVTSDGFEELKEYLDATISVPYTVLEHDGHVRPATYNRRPFVGSYQALDNCHILNGLGAKGASLAPFCVTQLINHILDGAEIHPEIDVNRVADSALNN